MAVAVAKAVSVRTSAYWGLGGLALATRPNDKIGVNDLTTTGVGAVTPPIDLSGINAGSVVEVVFGYLATGGNAESIVWDAAGIGCHFTQADNTLHVGTASFALGYDITTIRSDVHIIATFNGTTFSAYVIVNGVKHDSQLGIAAGTFIFDQILARTGETAATGTLYYIEIASGIGTPPAQYSPEVQAVLDRMSNLTAGEITAIETFVDGLVADNLWNKVYDCWTPAINDPTDAITGFKVKASTWLTPGGTNAHVPGQGWDFNAAGFMNTGENFNLIPATVNGFLLYCDSTSQYGPPDLVSTNTDYCGVVGDNGDNYLRMRTGTDHNVVWDQSGVTPRPAARGALEGDVCGYGGFIAANATLLSPGGVVESVSGRTDLARVTNASFHFNGRNSSGTQNAKAYRHSFWMFLDGAADTDLLQFRTRINQFLTDLGVTGVPV
jgi:hypothetical protein